MRHHTATPAVRQPSRPLTIELRIVRDIAPTVVMDDQTCTIIMRPEDQPMTAQERRRFLAAWRYLQA